MNNDVTTAEVLDAVVHLHGAMNLFATDVDEQFKGMNGRLDRVEHRLDGVERRLTNVEEEVHGLKDEFRAYSSPS